MSSNLTLPTIKGDLVMDKKDIMAIALVSYAIGQLSVIQNLSREEGLERLECIVTSLTKFDRT